MTSVNLALTELIVQGYNRLISFITPNSGLKQVHDNFIQMYVNLIIFDQFFQIPTNQIKLNGVLKTLLWFVAGGEECVCMDREECVNETNIWGTEHISNIFKLLQLAAVCKAFQCS